MTATATIHYLEMAKSYLDTISPKDDPLSEEMRFALCIFAAAAARNGDWDTYDRVMGRLPVDVEQFLAMLEMRSKEELIEWFKDMNMADVIKVFGNDYLGFDWARESTISQ
ncbi:MAG: hypothetical protein DELT_00476 [Desulfovibrio sp.]